MGGCLTQDVRFAPPQNADGTQQDRQNITGPLLAQYLLALMGPGRVGDPFSELLGGVFGPGGLPGGPGAPESGRWGDYVFNQEGTVRFIVCNFLLPECKTGVQRWIKLYLRSWRTTMHTSRCQLQKK